MSVPRPSTTALAAEDPLGQRRESNIPLRPQPPALNVAPCSWERTKRSTKGYRCWKNRRGANSGGTRKPGSPARPTLGRLCNAGSLYTLSAPAPESFQKRRRRLSHRETWPPRSAPSDTASGSPRRLTFLSPTRSSLPR